MKEADWLEATPFLNVYEIARARSRSRREERLFCVACDRRLIEHITDPRCLEGLDVAERFAEGREEASHRGSPGPHVRGRWAVGLALGKE